MEISAKNGEQFEFSLLGKDDCGLLAAFFESLSEQTRSKYGPHPLTREFVNNTLVNNLDKSDVHRYIIRSATKVIGYFIVDFNHYPDETRRYQSYQILLDSAVDPVFAPCIADDYQNQGVASQAMTALIEVLRQRQVRSLVLMGGTQAPNTLARRFYKKFGFEELGGFYTEHNGLDNFDMRLIL